MNPNEQCRLCNCRFKVKFGNSNISTENLFNPSKRKGCKGEILAQNLQRTGFEVVKCDKHSSRVCNPCARKIRNLGSLYSFVQESLQGKITEFAAATPPNSTSANKRLLETPEGKSPIRKSVRVLSPATKTNEEKSSRKSLEFVQERLQASEKENNDNTDQYLNIDNLPEGGLQVKVVFKTESENVLVRIHRDKTTKCLVRQVCGKNWHAAANSITKHLELFPEVLKAVNINGSNEMSAEYLKSESMLLSNKPDEIIGFSNTIFLEELRYFCPVAYHFVLSARGIQESDVKVKGTVEASCLLF